MKIKVSLISILDLMVTKQKKKLENQLNKTNLTNEDINKMNIALKEGNWRMI